MDGSREVDMEWLQYQVADALDLGWNDGAELWFNALPGGIGSTSCSISLTISDADSFEKSYIVSIHEVEDDSDTDC